MTMQLRYEDDGPARNTAAALRAPTLEELRRINIFSHLNNAELAVIAAQASVRRVRKGEEIVTKRASGNVACFSLDVQFKLIIMAPSGRQVILRTVKPGDHFGEDCSIGGVEQIDTIVLSETQGDYVELACVHLRRLVQDIHPLCFAVLQATALRSAALLDRVFELSVLDLRYRLLAEILRLSRSAKLECDSLVIRPAPTHEQFASIVGGTREGVTRELGALSEQGLIRVRRKEIRVFNIERLISQLTARSGVRPYHLALNH